MAILKHLRAYPWITSKDAFEIYGITRLSARIKDLRDKGYDIETVMNTVKPTVTEYWERFLWKATQ